MFSRDQLPESLFAISSLDFAIELLNDPIETAWFCFGQFIRWCRPRQHSPRHAKVLSHSARIAKASVCWIERYRELDRRPWLAINFYDAQARRRPDVSLPAGARVRFDHSGIRVEPLVSERVGERSSVFLINADLCLRT